MKERKYRVLKLPPELFLALEKAAAVGGVKPIDLAKFAINATLAHFKKNGAKVLASNSVESEVVSENVLSVQVDLSKLSQENLNWLSAEAARRNCSLGEATTQALEAWFGYISGDDAATRSYKCPICGKEMKVLAR